MKLLTIIGNSRTGTNFLRTSINSHRGVRCIPEVLNGIVEVRKTAHKSYFSDNDWLKSMTKKDSIKYIEEKIMPENNKHIRFGIKILFDHMDLLDMWKYLSEKEFCYILTLRNPIARYISYLQAHAINKWHSSIHEKSLIAPPVEIDMGYLHSYLDRTMLWESKAINMFKNVHIVHYKDMVENYSVTMERVFKYLGLANHEATTTTKKQQSWNFEERVLNFSEFSKELKSEYKYMLNQLV